MLPEASSAYASIFEPLALGQTRPRIAMRTTHKQELARPATEADDANWAAELLAYVGLNAGT
jgi:hypothetical protein